MTKPISPQKTTEPNKRKASSPVRSPEKKQRQDNHVAVEPESHQKVPNSPTKSAVEKSSPKKETLKLPYTTVVSDIEGTTTSISFVKDVLFPYVTDNVDEFLKTNFEDKKVQELIQDLKKQSQTDASEELDDFVPILDDESDQDKFIESIVNNIHWQMKHDRKVTALKAFQGYMWKTAYEKGEVQGEIYDDVLPAFEKWTESHIPIYIYSSGSISAQKLLFGYTKHGDLCKYFKGHFDTTIGSKLQPASYIDIAKKVGKEPKEILFLSDNVKELQAAKTAGYQVRLAIRPGNAKVTEEDLKLYRPFESFSTLF